MAAQGTKLQCPNVLKVRMPSLDTLNLMHAVRIARTIAQKTDVDSESMTPGFVRGLSSARAKRSQTAKIDAVQMVVWSRQRGTNSYLKTCKGDGGEVCGSAA